MRARALVVCAAVVLGSLAIVAPASASRRSVSPPSTFDFRCDVTFAAYPGSGSAYCPGEVTGVSVAGQVVPCLPTCTFAAAIDRYVETCATGSLSPSGEAWGSMSVNGVALGTFHWLRLGTNLYFLPDADFIGTGVWTPHPPIGTCAAPVPLTVTIAGHVSRT